MNEYSAKLGRRVLEVLAKGQAHKRALCDELDVLDYCSLDVTVTALCRDGRVIILGTAGEAGYTDIKRSAPVYGLPGTQLKDVTPPRRPTRTARKTARGSGVVAGPLKIRGYRYGWPYGL